MRRCLSIFILVMLPFQFSWAAAASYCQHETGKLASHFGHHEHKHQGVKVKSGGSERSDAVNKLGALDDDCALCHLGYLAPVAAAHVVDFVHLDQVHDLKPVHEFESHISGVPQRPDCSLAV